MPAIYHHIVCAEDVDKGFFRVSVSMDRDNPYVDFIQYRPNIVDNAEINSYLEGLETALSDLNSAHIPHLEIICRSRKIASDVLKLLLEGSVFSQYLSDLREVSLSLEGEQKYIGSHEILSTPTHLTQDGITIPLSAAQRAEWLLRNGHDGDRDRYLQGLLEAARVTAATLDAASQLAISTLPETEVGASARIEELAGGGKQGDEEGAGGGEERPDGGEKKHAAEEPRDEEDTGTDEDLDEGRVARGV